MSYFNADDAPSAKQANLFITIGERRYSVLNAKNFEAVASVKTADVPILGNIVTGKKAVGLEIKLKMTIYKCTEMFDDIIETFKNTGLLPRFEVQTTSEDKATSIGSTTKVYKDCMIDGDVLLSMFDADGEFVEQDIECFAMDYVSNEKYTTPSYM